MENIFTLKKHISALISNIKTLKKNVPDSMNVFGPKNHVPGSIKNIKTLKKHVLDSMKNGWALRTCPEIDKKI